MVVVPEVKVVFKNGGVLSSLDRTVRVEPILRDRTVRRVVAAYPVVVSGDSFTCDFGELKFRYQRGKVYVFEDRNRRVKSIWIGGDKVCEGLNLEHRMFVFDLPFSVSELVVPSGPASVVRLGSPPVKTVFPMPRTVKPVKMLIIVDVYDWAWDIASRELLKAMPEVKGAVVNVGDFISRNVRPELYNVVLMYPWGNSHVLDRLDSRNTVVCVAGGGMLDMQASFEARCMRFKYYGACNRRIKRVLEQRYPGKKVFLMSHGHDMELFKPSAKPSEFTVGWVGSTSRRIKRFPMAKAIVSDAKVKFKYAGYDSKRLPHRKMPRFYNSCSMLLVTSEYEAHPLVVYEAMGCGLPVVTTRVGDVAETMKDGVSGFILPVNAPRSAFVEVINRLKGDKSLRDRIGANARKAVVRKWGWKKVAKQYSILADVMKEGDNDG